MKIFEMLNSPAVKKVLGIASIMFTGITAIMNAVSERKKAEEFENLKEAVSKLQANKRV